MIMNAVKSNVYGQLEFSGKLKFEGSCTQSFDLWDPFYKRRLAKPDWEINPG